MASILVTDCRSNFTERKIMVSDNPLQPYVNPDGSIGAKPAVFDDNGELVPDPWWVEFLKEAYLGKPYDETLIEGPMPMVVNLGEFFSDPLGGIGYATVYQMNDGRKRISIVLDKATSEGLGDLTEVFKLRGIGFAGVKRRPQDDQG